MIDRFIDIKEFYRQICREAGNQNIGNVNYILIGQREKLSIWI